MPFPFAAIAALGGAALGAFGAHRANRANVHSAREQMRFQADQQTDQFAMNREMAKEQMGFQERMSNTAYQRAVKDLKAANLNPMLAYTQGGASTPPGSGGSVGAGSGSSSRSDNAFSNFASSALDMMRMRAEIKNIQSQTKLNEENAKVATSNVVVNANSAKRLQAETLRTIAETSAPEFWGRLYKTGTAVQAKSFWDKLTSELQKRYVRQNRVN